MQHELTFTRSPIDETALRQSRAPSPTSGAILSFLGVVRNLEDQRPIRALDYEIFQPMAEHQFRKAFDELAHRWPTLESVRLVHRIGTVPVGEPSLWVEIAAPHRAEAFAATQWLIDEMKRVVPIWKHALPAD